MAGTVRWFREVPDCCNSLKLRGWRVVPSLECPKLNVGQKMKPSTKGKTMLLTRYSNPQLNQWGAFEPLRRFQNDIERLFNSDQPAERNWLPALEVNEDKDKFLVTVELPGVNTADVKVTLEDDVLAISGERKYVGTAQSELRLSERYYGKFERSVRLPAPVQANHVTATGKDGVLTITLPKVEEARPREIKIEAAS